MSFPRKRKFYSYAINPQGDITVRNMTVNGSIEGVFPDTGVTAGTYSHATVTVDAQGRITEASSNDISGKEDKSAKNTANGYAGLSGGVIARSQLPAATGSAIGAVHGITRVSTTSTHYGYGAGGGNVINNGATSFGHSSNFNAGPNSTAVGYGTLLVNPGHTDNTAIGYAAGGLTIEEGSYNTFVGSQADSTDATSNHRIAIGAGATASADHQVAFPDDATAIKMVGLAEAANAEGALLAIDSGGIIAKVPAVMTPGAYPISTNPEAPTFLYVDAQGRIVNIVG